MRLQLSPGTLFAGLLLAACSGGGASEVPADGALSGQLIVTGSSTLAPLTAEIARRFESQHPQVRIDVQSGGSSRGIRDAREGSADIGMASRALKAAEQKSLLAHPIGVDEIALILHASNSVVSLTDDQIRAIYLGEISRWSEVGGDDSPITVVNKAAGRATLEVFVKYFALDERAIDADVVIGDNEQGIKTVAGNPDAIGYVSLGSAHYNASEGVPIRILDRSASGAGPVAAIARPLNLITRREVGPLAQSFLDYSQSSEVHDLIRGLYFEPLAKASTR